MKKDIVILFDTACIYEIVSLNYFLKFTGSETLFCTMNGKNITSMEGYRICIDKKISEIDLKDVRSIVVPGGNVSEIKNETVYKLLQSAKAQKIIIGAICAGVDVLDEAGILNQIESTHSKDVDYMRDQHIVTARANAYVDFALEMGKELELFKDEDDVEETTGFWKYHRRMQ